MLLRTLSTLVLFLACLLLDGSAALPQEKEKLVGKWRLDREATLALRDNANHGPDAKGNAAAEDAGEEQKAGEKKKVDDEKKGGDEKETRDENDAADDEKEKNAGNEIEGGHEKQVGKEKQTGVEKPKKTLPFDFELELEENGEAVSIAKVGGLTQRKSFRWKVVKSDEDGELVVEFLAPQGLPKRYTFKPIDDDHLQFRAQGAKHPLVLARVKQRQ